MQGIRAIKMATPNRFKTLSSDKTTPQSALSTIENLGVLSLDTVLSKVEINEITKKIKKKIYEILDGFDKIAGELHRHINSEEKLVIDFSNFDDDMQDQRNFEEVEWCRKTLESLTSKIDQMQGKSQDTYLDLQNMIFNIQIPDITKKSGCPFRAFSNQLIELSFKKKMERINNLIEKISAEKQVRNSVKLSKADYPGKNEWEIVKEMSESPLCSGLIQPLATSLECSRPLAWALIMEKFSTKP